MQTKFNLIWISATNDVFAQEAAIMCRQNATVLHSKYRTLLRRVSASPVGLTSGSRKIFGQETVKILLGMKRKTWGE